MFERLFGETEQEQLLYLKKKVAITAIFIIIDIIALIATGEAGLSIIVVYVWGWGAMKALFGITAIGSVFSGNAVMAAIFIGVYILLGAVCGAICMLLGIARFIYLMVKLHQSKG